MWAHLISMILGIWLMASPQMLSYDGLPADHDHVVGPIIASLACVALWQVTRGVRWINLLIGAWLLVAPWLLGFGGGVETANGMVVGAVLIPLSLVKGKPRHRYDGGWMMLFRRVPGGAELT